MKEDSQAFFRIGDFEDLLEVLPEKRRWLFNEQRNVNHRPFQQLEKDRRVRKEKDRERNKRMFSYVVDIRHIEQIFLTLQTAFRGRPGLRDVVTQIDQALLKREK